jgi:hypothetical protein
MSSKAEPGDIIQYEMTGNEGHPPYGVGIVDQLHDNGELRLLAWKRPGDKEWNFNMRGSLYDADKWWPHPDPDPVLADFTAWRLLNGDNNA